MGTACVLSLTSARSARAVFSRNTGEVLLTVGGAGALRVVHHPKESCTEVASSCSWRGGFDVLVEPPPGLSPRKSYRIVLELYQGLRQPRTGANRLALFETPVFRG